ncbi:MAG: hypothetical protein GX089_08525 [Fibrobacter sp.]|nr:hypothetical protein [Fibrobacter sp.]HON09812.1 hypothetical protein [Chitinispirillaceae bacterium]
MRGLLCVLQFNVDWYLVKGTLSGGLQKASSEGIKLANYSNNYYNKYVINLKR